MTLVRCTSCKKPSRCLKCNSDLNVDDGTDRPTKYRDFTMPEGPMCILCLDALKEHINCAIDAGSPPR